MTSKVLNNKFAMLHNARYCIKSSKGISILNLVLNLLGVPLLLAIWYYNITSGKSDDVSSGYCLIALAATAFAGALGIFFAAANYRELYSKPHTDMLIPMPLSTNQRFISSYFAGLFSYLVPFLLSQTVSLIMFLFGYIFLDGKSFQMLDGKTIFEFNNVFPKILAIYLHIFVYGILAMIMLYTFTILIFCCCGTLVASSIFSIAANAAVPLTIYLVGNCYFSNVYGIDFGNIIQYITELTSPVGGCMAAFYSIDGVDSGLNMNLGLWVVIYFAVILVMFAGAWLLYRKRRAEQTSRNIVFSAFYYIVMTLVVLVIAFIFKSEANTTDLIPAFFIVSAFIYALVSVLMRKGLKNIWKDGIAYVSAVAMFFIFTVAADKSNCFGLITKIPNPEQVKSVQISYSGIYQEFPSAINYGSNDKDNSILYYTFTDQSSIDTVVNVHKLAVNKYLADKNSVDNSSYNYQNGIKIIYHLKNGGSFKRSYSFAGLDGASNEMLNIEKTEDFRNQSAKHFADLIRSTADHDYSVYGYDSLKNGNIPIILNVNTWEYGGQYVNVSKEFVKELADAVEADIKAMSAHEYIESRDGNCLKITFDFIGFNVDVRNSYKNTIALLNEKCPDQMARIKEIELKNTEEFINPNTYLNKEIYLLSYDDYTAATGRTAIVSEYSGDIDTQYYGRKIDFNTIKSSDKYLQLLTNVKRMYNTNEKCYTICAYGTVYAVIPEQYSYVASELYNQLPVSSTDTEQAND